jgi:ubiquinone/menaquinone biosynthesis C-methylase UbiE
MRILTLGAWERRHRQLAEAAVPSPGSRVLEIGCGTGGLTAALLARGAHVVGIDQDPAMLDRARARLGASDRVELVECTASEIDRFGEGAFDAVASSLAFSEMSASERGYVLRAALKALRPGGVLALADEVVPTSAWQRTLQRGVRLPLALITWVVAGRLSHAIPDLANEIRAAGLRVTDEKRSSLGTYAQIMGERAP